MASDSVHQFGSVMLGGRDGTKPAKERPAAPKATAAKEKSKEDVLEGSDDEAVDPHLEQIKNDQEGGAGYALDSDEEDEDFVPEKDDAGSPTDDSDEEDSDSSEDGDEEKPATEKKKEPAAPKRKENGEEDGKKKKRRKKDPNAPKRAMSAFMYFSQAERDVLKKKDPGLQFNDISKAIGERWKKLSEEEKEPYEAGARLDKVRYHKEMAEYRSGAQTAGNGSSNEESE